MTKDRPETLELTLKRLKELGIYEIIRVVDGSEEDSTKEVAERFGIKYQKQRSVGRIGARNEALTNCSSEYIIFLDDDVEISESWFKSIKESFRENHVVGVTGQLEGEQPSFSGILGKIRNFLFGGQEVFGEIQNNGVINGDFFYEKKKEVDHMVGCNMAFDVETLREVGGFNEDYDVGNAYREETESSYLVGQKGKIIYKPRASVNHLNVEDVEPATKHFYKSYLTKYFLHKNKIVRGIKGRLSYYLNKLIRHLYFLLTLRLTYRYYIYGEIKSFIDFIIFDREPREYV